MINGASCSICQEEFGDDLTGAVLKDRLAVFEYVYHGARSDNIEFHIEHKPTVAYDDKQDPFYIYHKDRYGQHF